MGGLIITKRQRCLQFYWVNVGVRVVVAILFRVLPCLDFTGNFYELLNSY